MVGNREPVCAGCGSKFTAKRTGRKREYCSNRCRDEHRRQLNFSFYGKTGHREAKPQNAKNPQTVSKNCEAVFAGRASPDQALRHRIIEIEIINAHSWTPGISADGVVFEQAILRKSARVGKGIAP